MRGATRGMAGAMSHNWPWTWDARPRGWFTANGLTKYGPLPERERSDETWPPARLERNQQTSAICRAATPQMQRIVAASGEGDAMEAARQHFARIIDTLPKAKT